MNRLTQGLMAGAGGLLDAIQYVDDVFSTYLYTGNGTTQTITNGIDLAGQGGLVWIKSRSATESNYLFDTLRGVNSEINSDTADAATTLANSLTAFNGNGFSVGSAAIGVNTNAATYASWTFRKAPKFFDVVTYTGTGVARTVPHSLGQEVGAILVKRTNTAEDWAVYHRSTGNTQYLGLNLGQAAKTSISWWNNTTPTTSEFTVGTSLPVNDSGGTYVAYLFAHDPSADGIIQCGTYTGNGNTTGPTVTLGWEPQWVLIKSASANATDWVLLDSTRGTPTNGASDYRLLANITGVEAVVEHFSPLATGFTLNGTNSNVNGTNASYVYIAIRRPNKPPLTATEVFTPVAHTGTGANTTVNSGFVTDLVIQGNRAGDTLNFGVWNRLNANNYVRTASNAAQVAAATTIVPANPWDTMTGFKVGTTSTLTNASGNNFIYWMFRRAAKFMDVVYYTGNGVAGRQIPHNLAAVPELIIVKNLNGSQAGTRNWAVYASPIGANRYLELNSNSNSLTTNTYWNSTTPTAVNFTVGTATQTNGSGELFSAQLFTTLVGVSKVGSYTGNGTSQTINCGFTTGARFILIKQTDALGDWYVWDTARGIVAGNDPRLSLNTTAAEVSDDSVDPDPTGFIVNQLAATNINVSGGQYVFFAVA